MAQSHWEDGNTKCLGMLVDGRAQNTGIRKHGADTSILIVMNRFAGWSTSHFRNAKAQNPFAAK
jgi:isoamylase